MPSNVPQPDAVFLNVPFDTAYEAMFVALVTAVVASGLVPRCAIELPERGEGQFQRIVGLLRECRMSIHELSRTGIPARYNMPFELGLAVALQTVEPKYQREFILLEARRGQVAKHLSDMRGVVPIIHGNSPLRLLAAVLDNLGSGASPREVERVHRKLMEVVPPLKRKYRTDKIFTKAIFKELVEGAIEGAIELNLLKH